jgi:RNA polymerase sigma factor (sigma-70 family)
MPTNIVLIVDEDEELQRALRRVLRSAGFQVETHRDGASLLRHPPNGPACVLMDVCLPGCSGLELQQRLGRWQPPPAVVLMSAESSVSTVIEGMRQGAVDFLIKPLHTRPLLAAVEQALARSARLWAEKHQFDELRARMERLTSRERQVFDLVTEGLMNKQVAAHLGITEKTVKVHRSRVMDKLHVDSLPALVRLADQVEAIDASQGIPLRRQRSEAWPSTRRSRRAPVHGMPTPPGIDR